ncbi:hypothetical protein MLD52_05380 [Puniceicoccaceae bacterium K14]|nr:hypothetical protein [Puniceicoccaceae bacterium K14]
MIELRKILGTLIAVSVIGISNCFAGSEKKLDISDYLSHAEEGVIYPTEAQQELLRPLIPDYTYEPVPSIDDREFWNSIAEKESAQKIYKEAIESLKKKPEVPITDEIYRRANKEGNRGIYKPRYYRTMEVLENAVIGECIENEGRFIPQIIEHINAIMEMKSWLHPNHDDNDNDVLEGRRVDIDLGARKFGSVLMVAEVLLEDKLPTEVREEIVAQIKRRMTDFYLDRCKSTEDGRKGLSWMWSRSNWNSVCTSGTLFCILTASSDPEEHLVAIGCAINSMKYYLSGFGDDGYCSEGVGYWIYGFGNYLYLAQMVYDFTKGGVDLFQFDNPEKMNRVGNFPANYQIQNGVYPCFADGAARIKAGNDNFAYTMSAKHYGARKPSYSRPPDIVNLFMEWNDPVSYVATESDELELSAYSYFYDSGAVISRGGQDVPFSIAIKAGHNAENHNHMDVGSYVMVLEDDHVMCGDLGAPPYKAGAFSPNHKVRSSWGHPVPRVDGTLQSEGREFRGEVLETVFSENSDKVVLDIKAAYEVDGLEKLIRTMVNDKSGNGTITITDEFTASNPIAFDTAIVTHGPYEVINDDMVVFSREGRSITVKISAEGGTVKVHDLKIPVEDIRYADEAFKIWIDFEKKLKSGSITMVFTPN